MFARVLARLALPAEDPAWTLACAPSSRPVPRQFLAPPCWRGLCPGGSTRLRAGATVSGLVDASGRLLLAAWPRNPRAQRAGRDGFTGWRRPQSRLDRVAMAWLIACRRWLRRGAGLGLADLVRRPARLTLSATHADLDFDLRAADVRVRRAGLDVDPGWVPWFGRVIGYRYTREGAP
jgi:hypothetical protein